MSEKLTDSISKLIKKTSTFEKVETLLKGISLFMFITGAVTLYNSYKLHKMTTRLHLSKNNMEYRINANFDKIIETNQKIILLIEHNIKLQSPVFSSCNNDELVKKQISLIEKNDNNSDNKIYNDAEFLNECYDNIPCNNSKKVTGLNRLFEWK